MGINHGFLPISVPKFGVYQKRQRSNAYRSKFMENIAYASSWSAIMLRNGKYTSTAGIELEIPKTTDVGNVEEAITKIASPVRVVLDIKPLDSRNIKEELEFKAAKMESKLKEIRTTTFSGRSEAKAIEARSKRLREAAELISKGIKPFMASFYVLASSSSRNADYSEHDAAYMLESVRNAFESLYACKSRRLSGKEVFEILGGTNE